MAIWHVSKGQSRTVIAIPSLGIAIKRARVRTWPFKNLYGDVVDMGKEMLPNPDPYVREMYWESVRLSIRRCFRSFFKGFADNWNERSLYKHTNALHRLFLQPTYVSLLGIVNVQKYGVPANRMDGLTIAAAFYKVAGQALVYDGHHWTHAQNFHLAIDGPKALDYGDPATQKIIGNFGTELYVQFEKNFKPV